MRGLNYLHLTARELNHKEVKVKVSSNLGYQSKMLKGEFSECLIFYIHVYVQSTVSN